MKKTIGKLVMALLLSSPLTLSAADYYWGVNGSGTWDTTSAVWSPTAVLGTLTGTTTTNADTIYFSANGVAAQTITLAGTQVANQIWLKQPNFDLTFSGGTIDLTSGVNKVFRIDATGTITNFAVKTTDIYFQTANQTLTLKGGAAGNFFSGQVYTSAANAKLSTLVLASGTFTAQNTGVKYNIGDFDKGENGVILEAGAVENTVASWHVGYGYDAVFKIDGGTKLQTGGNIVLGRDSSSRGLMILDKGTVSSTAGDLLIGLNQATGQFDVNGGVATISARIAFNVNNTGKDAAYGVMNVNGGTVSAKGVLFGAGDNAGWKTTFGSGTLTMNGGRLNLGTEGMVNSGSGTSRYAVILNGGTLGATAAWSSTLNMKLTNDSGGVKFDTTGGKIELSGVLSGDGGFAKAGTGTLLLSGANTYTGDTIVSAGNLQLDSVSALGGVANLALGSGVTVNLNYSGTAMVDGLFYAGDLISGLELGKGYTYSELNTILGGASIFSGGGLLAVSTIPEPSALALMVTGGALLLFLRRKR